MAIRLTGLARCGIAATLVIDDQVQTVAKNNPGATVLLAGLALMGLAAGSTFGTGEAVLRIEMDKQRPHVVFLSWDTEDGSRAATNLLRTVTAMRLRLRSEGQGKPGDDLALGSVDSKSNAMIYRFTPAPMFYLLWSVNPTRVSLSTTLSRQGTSSEPSAGVELLIPFDPRVTPTTVLPSQWEEDGSLRLPAVINAPDFGQMLLSESRGQPLKSRLEGSRADKVVDLIVELPPLKSGESCTLNLVPIRLPAPQGLVDETLWEKARRGWFGAFQSSARWGDQTRPFSAPAGPLANNVISDPASCSLWFYADQAMWTPQLTPEISVATLVRRTLDWWLDQRTRPTGEVICYWDYGNFVDANAGPLIAAWDYVEATSDKARLGRRIERLEFIAEFLARRDVDNDGFVEAVQSGNRGTLKQPARLCAWFDALNCGHKDGYTNALIYRAWRCLADYGSLADRLKASYAKTLYNPATGWLACWKSEAGELHDYASPVVNGLAIEYGLVEPVQGREIFARLWAKMDQVGFTHVELGIPPMLVPVRRSDYLLPDGLGIPQREDGTDTLGHYQNGGITAGQVADRVLGRQLPLPSSCAPAGTSFPRPLLSSPDAVWEMILRNSCCRSRVDECPWIWARNSDRRLHSTEYEELQDEDSLR